MLRKYIGSARLRFSGFAMSDGKKNTLEIWVVEKLKEIGITAHRTPGSGCGDIQKGDISNPYFAIECKMRHTQENITMSWNKDWLKLLSGMPMQSNKIPLFIVENKYGNKFVTLEAKDFFNIIKNNQRCPV